MPMNQYTLTLDYGDAQLMADAVDHYLNEVLDPLSADAPEDSPVHDEFDAAERIVNELNGYLHD